MRDLRRAFDLERSAAMARRLGAALLQKRDFAEARIVLEQGVTLPGATWREHWLLGYARHGAGGLAEVALSAFSQAAKLTEQPAELADVSVGAALAEVELGRVNEAVERLSRAGPLEGGPRAGPGQPAAACCCAARWTAWRRATANAAQKDVELAEKFPLAKQPDLAKLAAFTRALVLTEDKRFAEATAALKKASPRRPAGPRPTRARSPRPICSTARSRCPRRARRSPPPRRSPRPGRPSGSPRSPTRSPRRG